jgi:uncharacterized small protein (DUF1192 family)
VASWPGVGTSTLHVDDRPVRVYSVKAAAETLGLTERTLVRQAREGKLRGIQAWRPSTEPNPFPKWFFRADHVDDCARTQGRDVDDHDTDVDELTGREEQLRRREEIVELHENFLATNRVAELEGQIEQLQAELAHERAQRAAAESELADALRLFAASVARRQAVTADSTGTGLDTAAAPLTG